MEALGKLFGSIARVKLMKLFLFNTEEQFTKQDIMQRAKITQSAATREIGVLERAGMIRRKKFFQEVDMRGGTKKKRVQGFVLNKDFKFILPLQSMLIYSAPMQSEEIMEHLGKTGKVKAVIVAGVFIQDPESRIDLLIAGDDISKIKLKNAIANMEAEIGCELRYAVFDTLDLKYRLSICDRLIRDVFDYPHTVVIDRIGLS